MAKSEVDYKGISLPQNELLTNKETHLEIRPMILRNKRNINKNGEAKVYIEIVTYFDNVRKIRRIPTDVYVNPINWRRQKVIKSDPQFAEKNILVGRQQLKYESALLNREVNTWSPSEILEMPVQIQDMFQPKTKTLTSYIDDYIEVRQAQQTPRGTLKEFTTCKNRLKKYEDERGIKLNFEDMNMGFSNNFYSFLIKSGYKSGTIEKTYTILRTILNYYYEMKDELHIDLTDKFRSKKFKKGEKSINDPHPLSKNEFDVLMKHSFDADNLNKTKDRFVLQCSTGMRYSDLFTITPDKIVGDCIEYYPKKTPHKRDNLVICPLNQISREILERYEYNTTKLYISNQKYNASLSQMFQELNTKYPEITFDTYTSHNGRDTFITFSLEENVPVPYLLKMVGQSSFDIMKRYFRESKAKLIENMSKVTIFN